MKILVYFIIGLISLWLQLTLAPMLEVGWLKPNFLLLTVIVAGLTWMDPWLFIYAAGVGLAQDVFSHGLIGLYGTSFFFVAIASRMVGTHIYEHNLIFHFLGVFGLSVFDGILSSTLYNFFDASVPWWGWLFKQVIPQSLYNGMLGPLMFIIFQRLENRLKWNAT